MKNIWLQRLALHQCPCVNFLSCSNLVQHVLPKLVQKTMDLHVLHSLETTTIVCASFDILMSKGGVDTFASVINYLDKVGFHNMLL